ncbi:hypothetical protein D5018_03055 [Parashewanella curva]|uniref:Protein kinase domain-containing protein n=1 Tax=Parashewanella curva TaxID=2338552 RepID=A0A3L8Q0U2_9GAMM|nr:serine/threonine-protein kinase [Parashewanella curva]RLV61251.1 hypothetical protein D5018_03055 [Parashewanella curva]
MYRNDNESVSSVVEIGDCYYVKHYSDVEFLHNEWRAIELCSGEYGRARNIQKGIAVQFAKRLITLEYNAKAISLSDFTENDVQTFCSLLPRLISVIHHCHTKGIVHGDIKPSNILYERDTEKLTLIDFAGSLKLGGLLPSKLLSTVSYSYVLNHNDIQKVTTALDWWGLFQIIQQVVAHRRSNELNRKVFNIINSFRLVLASDLPYDSIMKSLNTEL